MSKRSRPVLGLAAGALLLVCGAYVMPGSPVKDYADDAASSLGIDRPAEPSTEKIDAKAIKGAEGSLEKLPVADLGSGDGYERDAFGQRWADLDHNGCDQRNDALRAAGTEVKAKPGTHDCVVVSAQIKDLYTGETISFVKGENTVDIDHIVPLSRSWQQGAADWDEDRREEFANTQENLVAVDASANRSKGDRGPEEWMPDAGQCTYSVRWVEVKEDFDLSVTAAEKRALEKALDDCGGEG
ncbi:HNH endonuclease family protein [Brachybacterium kimchii]|uniref:HNH endonuclease family protein n=1 Tax=Brachybacterium kimchii TaxID=2942909 RepID=A0ABY4NB66_9MICO|nr:HNH endonuclease family protein [Brachybacterium kimchii]UQN31803.1 HNH endonuclease family protein [Brachybacterium kimchii]